MSNEAIENKICYAEDFNALPACACGHCQKNGKTVEECQDPIYFEPNCHPGAGTNVHYDPKRTVIEVTCKECSQHMATVKVASDGRIPVVI